MRLYLSAVIFVLSLNASIGALAGEIGVQMIVADDIRKAANPSLTEGIESSSVGAVYFPDKVLAATVERLDGDGIALLASWSKSHRFLIVPFSIGIRPEGDRIPKRVDVILAFEDLGDLTRQPIVTDIFPPNGFKKTPFEGKANLKISGKGSFAHSSGVEAGVEAGLDLSYTYAPAYANVFSGFASGHAFWQFSRTQDSYPVGNIPMKLLLIVPRSYKENELFANFDVKVSFDGGIWSGGSVAASFSSSIALPEEN